MEMPQDASGGCAMRLANPLASSPSASANNPNSAAKVQARLKSLTKAKAEVAAAGSIKKGTEARENDGERQTTGNIGFVGFGAMTVKNSARHTIDVVRNDTDSSILYEEEFTSIQSAGTGTVGRKPTDTEREARSPAASPPPSASA